jgi:hypothetical protein
VSLSSLVGTLLCVVKIKEAKAYYDILGVFVIP